MNPDSGEIKALTEGDPLNLDILLDPDEQPRFDGAFIRDALQPHTTVGNRAARRRAAAIKRSL